jgi:serine/threonine protein phosphatase 1
MKPRILAIGDIHGCRKTFVRLLEKVRLVSSDTLYLLGDYVDRGPDTKGVIETIMRLQRQGFDLRPIRGNHEQMLLDAVCADSRDLWLDNGGIYTLMSYGVRSPAYIPREDLLFLSGLPLYRMTETHVFVHAGLNLTLDDPFSPAGEEAMLWARDTQSDLSKLGGKTLVTGHTPVDLDEIRRSIGSNHIRLDNGCVFAEWGGLGHLVALDLETGELFLQRYMA